ncbi:hypothetical protein KKH63_03545 [Patescibacteria group bacterium]|nr:hypothetical protein [Patescibacteria group bacterium]
MRRKIIVSLLIIAFLVVAGGSFYWWQNQQDVREINKTLPEGIKVVKGLFNKEYKVVNNIDGYEFNVPKAWEGIEKIEYVPEEEEAIFDGTKVTGIGLKGSRGGATAFSIDVYLVNKLDLELIEYAKEIWVFYGLDGELKEEKINGIPIVKGFEEKHLMGTFVYFLKNGNNLYIINNGSEEFIQEIILNGKW